MAHKQTSRNSQGVCEKLFNAISSRRKIRLISNRFQASTSTEAAQKTQVKTSFVSQTCHKHIPIEYEPPLRPSPIQAKEDDTKRNSEIPIQETTRMSKTTKVPKDIKDKKIESLSSDSDFSKYIEHVKHKMWTAVEDGSNNKGIARA